ncbi:1695_t:CDS:2 [Gigaspora margarita]|uniref:1695_t:CDS:1 n=1 Tax=Gigaspora margarita TaxID=4874 RepID=A0ABN7UAA2_GIGMA|nr:1695_t:CDS:2 [Gigaspora margarita]
MQYIILNSLDSQLSDSSANIETQKKPPKTQHKPRTNQIHTTYFFEEMKQILKLSSLKYCKRNTTVFYINIIHT